MNREDLKQRTKVFALRAVRLGEALPRRSAGDVLGRQLLRSATSVGANDRSACRGRSGADFVAKLGVVIEEADESGCWMDLIEESGLMHAQRMLPLRQEASELGAIFTASVKTARDNLTSRRIPQRAGQIRNPKSVI